MRIKRTITPIVTADYNEFAKAVNDEELVIFANGKMYEEIKKKVKKEKKVKKSNKRGKILGILLMMTAPASGPIGPVIGGIEFLCSIGGRELKKYTIVDNKKENRIELYRNTYSMNRDDESFDKEYDTVLIN